MSANNPYLTAKNEINVNKLSTNTTLKARWQIMVYQQGKAYADKVLAQYVNLPVSTIRAARFYWSAY